MISQKSAGPNEKEQRLLTFILKFQFGFILLFFLTRLTLTVLLIYFIVDMPFLW